jgi:ribosomal protein L20
MSQQRRARTEADEKREREQAEAAKGNFGDRAARARTADDPIIKAPRDRAGMPSTGDEQLE